jgi:hypothetical protein
MCPRGIYSSTYILVSGCFFYFYEEPRIPVLKTKIKIVLVLVPHINETGN